MANPILCISGDGAPAAWLVTNLADGDTAGLCADCFPNWVIAMAGAMQAPVDEPVPVVPAEAAEAPNVDPGAADGAPGGDTLAESKRAARARRGRPEYEQADPGPTEDVPTPAPASGND